MSLKSQLALPIADVSLKHIYSQSKRAAAIQKKVFEQLISNAKNTRFGIDHHFKDIKTHTDFFRNVPIRDYEGLKIYTDRIKKGEENVLWPGQPRYLAKTSGTTSGTKYIPITNESIKNHVNSARNCILAYMHHSRKASFLNGKYMFLSGSPKLHEEHGMYIGRLSGISQHHVASYLKKNNLPTFKTNCIEDWEEKVDAVVQETHNQNMTLISGIPPWVAMYFEKLLAFTNANTVLDVFPNLEVFIFGGVNYEPYRNKMKELIGGNIQTMETFPASEGFFAYQDTLEHRGLLLTFNSGIFYEFIPVKEFENENPTRLTLADVELDTNYVLIVNSNAGLWGYNVGDTIKFVSLVPPRIVVTGRIKHFISAFGEHVIGEEVDKALTYGLQEEHAQVSDFHVAPLIEKEKGQSCHEWYISFEKRPADISTLEKYIDVGLQELNNYYKDLRTGNMLAQLKIIPLPANAFVTYMAQKGKLGGQNKVPRLSNNRVIADALLKIIG